MFKLIAFDLDDTLYPEKAYLLSGLKAVSKLLEERIGIVGFYDESVRLFEKGVRGRIFEATLANMGIECESELISEMVDCYDSHLPNISLYNDVMFALRYLKRNYRLVLITDGNPHIQRKKIEALRIENFFEKILYTDMLGKEFRKPNPRPFHEVTEHFEVTHHECVYIADNPWKDFLAPNELGWLTVRVKRGNGLYLGVAPPSELHKAKIAVENLYEFIDILKQGVNHEKKMARNPYFSFDSY